MTRVSAGAGHRSLRRLRARMACAASTAIGDPKVGVSRETGCCPSRSLSREGLFTVSRETRPATAVSSGRPGPVSRETRRLGDERDICRSAYGLRVTRTFQQSTKTPGVVRGDTQPCLGSVRCESTVADPGQAKAKTLRARSTLSGYKYFRDVQTWTCWQRVFRSAQRLMMVTTRTGSATRPTPHTARATDRAPSLSTAAR